MESAVRVYSWQGFFVERIKAGNVKSRSDARRLGPFATLDQKELVTWVRPSWQENHKTRKAHFRRLPHKQIEENFIDNLRREVEAETKSKGISTLHNQSRDSLAEELKTYIGKSIPWIFKDNGLSDFPIRGNLMRAVEKIEVEYTFKTPFGLETIRKLYLT